MNRLTHDEFFRKATGPDHSLYGYQCRLARGSQEVVTGNHALSVEEQSHVADWVADSLRIQGKFRSEPLDQPAGKGHYASQTAEAIRKATTRTNIHRPDRS